uniref:PIN domain-containing protein n=1 Tax=Candidatus Kentrum sp. DK TaxID=2126562 RepID=A0A450RXR8_9GAMM|nr:MAG: PIN domain-containing protein [Candidatus Kentron sp. DK]VFJ53460.1 MAG: PIN domain-containing protein [Candidatus Kentron sp. DK]
MLIYLDNCCLQRPLDDRSQSRINREAEAILAVLDLIESGAVRLLSSQVIEWEIRRIPDWKRRHRDHAMEVISLADTVATVSGAAYRKAKELASSGVDAMDALHAAVAIDYHADYFCTADDRFLKRLKALRRRRALDWGLLPCFVSPLELATEVIPR